MDDEVMWCADGSSFPVEYWSNPMFRGGETIGTVVTFVDITSRKRIEAELRQSRERTRVILDTAYGKPQAATVFQRAHAPHGAVVHDAHLTLGHRKAVAIDLA